MLRAAITTSATDAGSAQTSSAVAPERRAWSTCGARSVAVAGISMRAATEERFCSKAWSSAARPPRP